MRILSMIILVIFIIGLITVKSCTPAIVSDHNIQVESTTENTFYFVYDNHNYIQFGTGDVKCIVHSPDCLNSKCKR